MLKPYLALFMFVVSVKSYPQNDLKEVPQDGGDLTRNTPSLSHFGESCELTTRETGVCMKTYMCTDSQTNRGGCSNFMDVCCSVSKQNISPVTPSVTSRPITPPVTTPPVTALPPVSNPQECGWINPSTVASRIAGGDVGAGYAEFPWMVAILKRKTKGTKNYKTFACAGTLIHRSLVLSAAHSLPVDNDYVVRAGVWDVRSNTEARQDRNVSKLVLHKDFNKGNLYYDVALLFLASPMDLTDSVRLACLPPPKPELGSGRPDYQVRDGTRCLVAGWGKDRYDDTAAFQTVLQKVEVPIMSDRECQRKLRQTRLKSQFMLHSSFICAGGELGKDSCKGDGGAGLVCPIEFEPGRYIQTGIVSWGINCGQDGTPGVYVDVSHVRGWIDDKASGEGYELYLIQL